MKEVKTISRIPVACTLTKKELFERQADLKKTILSHIRQVKELENGYSFAFLHQNNIIQQLGEFIDFEIECCPFLQFTLMVSKEKNDGMIWLLVQGKEGSKEFLREGLQFIQNK